MLGEVSSRVVIHNLYISPGHNFFGRHGQPPGEHTTLDVESVKCRAGCGLEGDRFCGYRANYKGQVTFFAWETYIEAKRHFEIPALSAAAFRRNVVIEGADLNALIGATFSIGGVQFEGMEESRPCYWMDGVVAPGAEDWLRGRGGLRVRVLTDGELRIGEQDLKMIGVQPELVGFGARSLIGT
jgi:MOSC domain-containing protein YiiM